MVLSRPQREGEKGAAAAHRSVDIALLVGAVAGLGGLAGGVVLALLRVAVGLGALQERILSRLLVLGLSLQYCTETVKPLPLTELCRQVQFACCTAKAKAVASAMVTCGTFCGRAKKQGNTKKRQQDRAKSGEGEPSMS